LSPRKVTCFLPSPRCAAACLRIPGLQIPSAYIETCTVAGRRSMAFRRRGPDRASTPRQRETGKRCLLCPGKRRPPESAVTNFPFPDFGRHAGKKNLSIEQRPAFFFFRAQLLENRAYRHNSHRRGGLPPPSENQKRVFLSFASEDFPGRRRPPRRRAYNRRRETLHMWPAILVVVGHLPPLFNFRLSGRLINEPKRLLSGTPPSSMRARKLLPLGVRSLSGNSCLTFLVANPHHRGLWLFPRSVVFPRRKEAPPPVFTWLRGSQRPPHAPSPNGRLLDQNSAAFGKNDSQQ